MLASQFQQRLSELIAHFGDQEIVIDTYVSPNEGPITATVDWGFDAGYVISRLSTPTPMPQPTMPLPQPTINGMTASSRQDILDQEAARTLASLRPLRGPGSGLEGLIADITDPVGGTDPAVWDGLPAERPRPRLVEPYHDQASRDNHPSNVRKDR